MTDLLNTDLQTLGTKIATNLTAQGVSSSASEGLTTLANKILNVDISGTITLTTNKSILNNYGSENATLTATYSKGAGYALEIYNADTNTKLGNMTDNQNGTYSYTYNSTGNGDINLKAIRANDESNNISIEDCMYFNSGNNTTDLTIASGITVTTSNDGLKVTTSKSSELLVKFPITLQQSDNYILEMEIGHSGTIQHLGGFVNTSATRTGFWCAFGTDNTYSGGIRNSTFNGNATFNVGDKMIFKHLNGVYSVYHNNTQLYSKTTTFTSSSYKFGVYTNANRVQYLKNIKAKKISS